MTTKMTTLFGIQHPIIQGGMAWVADAQLAAAVSNAGGLGMISAYGLSGQELRAQIHACRELTDKPFGVNIMLMSPQAQEAAQIAAQEKVAVVTTSAGLPTRFMPIWRDAGIKVVPVVANVAMAKRVARDGASAVIAEGYEAGGHVGELTTLTLVPQIADAVDLPVIAAGGIADGRGLVAVLMLGAAGAQVGTRFLAADECGIPQCFKDEVLRARDTDTMVAGKRRGIQVRALKNSYMQELAEQEMNPHVSNAELEQHGSGALWRAVKEGDMVTGCIMAGQAAALVKETMPAAQIIAQIMQGVKALMPA